MAFQIKRNTLNIKNRDKHPFDEDKHINVLYKKEEMKKNQASWII
jgi:hypothetical protein